MDVEVTSCRRVDWCRTTFFFQGAETMTGIGNGSKTIGAAREDTSVEVMNNGPRQRDGCLAGRLATEYGVLRGERSPKHFLTMRRSPPMMHGREAHLLGDATTPLARHLRCFEGACFRQVAFSPLVAAWNMKRTLLRT